MAQLVIGDKRDVQPEHGAQTQECPETGLNLPGLNAHHARTIEADPVRDLFLGEAGCTPGLAELFADLDPPDTDRIMIGTGHTPTLAMPQAKVCRSRPTSLAEHPQA